MASLYVVLYQFTSATNAKNFVASNSGIDASLATVSTAAGEQPGNWVVVFPETLSQLPGGFAPQFTYNGNVQMITQFSSNLDITTISITAADGTPIFHDGLPVTDLANGPAASVTGHWQGGGWAVQYIYPHPTANASAVGSCGVQTLYEFGANNPPPVDVRRPFPPGPPYTQGGVVSASSVVNVFASGFTVTGGNASASYDITGGGTIPADQQDRDLGILPGVPGFTGVSATFSGTTITATASGFSLSDYHWYFNEPLLEGVFALMGSSVDIATSKIDLSMVQFTKASDNSAWVFNSVTSVTGSGTAEVSVSFTIKPKPSS